MITYKVVGNLIQEVADGLITGVWERGDISESVKNQLISKGGKEIEDFFIIPEKVSPVYEPEKPIKIKIPGKRIKKKVR